MVLVGRMALSILNGDTPGLQQTSGLLLSSLSYLSLYDVANQLFIFVIVDLGP